MFFSGLDISAKKCIIRLFRRHIDSGDKYKLNFICWREVLHKVICSYHD